MKNLVSLGIIILGFAATANADLTCTVNKVAYGQNRGDEPYHRPKVGSVFRFDPDQKEIDTIIFTDHSFVSLGAVKVDSSATRGWEYFWHSSTRGSIRRVIYSTDGQLLIQFFRYYPNQQYGFSEYHLNCK